VSIMGNKGLVLDGNTGGTPTDNSGEPGAVLRIVLERPDSCRRGRPFGAAGSATPPCGSRI